MIAAPVVLALRALGLGDLLTAVPAVRALRRRFTRAELVLATPAPLAPLVARIGGVDRVLRVRSSVTEPPAIVDWSGPPPDLAVNLHGVGPQSVAALSACAPTQLWSYSVPGAPPWDPGEHETARWCRLVRWHGCVADPADLRLGTGSHDGPVVVHPGAASSDRCWPVERFGAVARALTADGAPVVLTGDSDDLARCRAVADVAGLPVDRVLAGRTDLSQLAELVAGARLVVCGDTGVGHLASAYATPSVLLFGPQPPSRWGPPAGGPHTVLWRPPDVRNLDVGDVLGAARETLAAVRSGR